MSIETNRAWHRKYYRLHRDEILARRFERRLRRKEVLKRRRLENQLVLPFPEVPQPFRVYWPELELIRAASIRYQDPDVEDRRYTWGGDPVEPVRARSAE